MESNAEQLRWPPGAKDPGLSQISRLQPAATDGPAANPGFSPIYGAYGSQSEVFSLGRAGDGERDGRDTGTSWLDVAAVLLVIQAGIGLVAALGAIVFGAAVHDLPAMAGAILVALVGPLVMIWLAGGLARARRWAKIGTLIIELGVLAGASVRLLIGKDLAFSLLPTLTGIFLPLAVIIAIARRQEHRS